MRVFNWILWFLCIMASLSQVSCQKSPEPDASPENHIQRIYTAHQPFNYNGSEINFGDKEILLQYFDNDLTNLFLNDLECQIRYGGICNIDFDPIYDAQNGDGGLLDLEIKPITNNSHKFFTVSFTNFNQRISLKYQLIQTENGWKVSDIIYPSGVSLKAILSREI